MNTSLVSRIASLVLGTAFAVSMTACGHTAGAPTAARQPAGTQVHAEPAGHHGRSADRGLIATGTAQQPADRDGAEALDTDGVARIQLPGRRSEIGAYIAPTSTMQEFLYQSLMDVHQYWSGQFASWGFAQPQVSYEFPGTAAQATSRCGAAEPLMQYCPLDDTISVSEKTAIDLWNGSYGTLANAGTGDMSVAVIVAHEYGHAIGQELGYGPIGAAAKERLADCLAGVWAAGAQSRGILDVGDVAEAANGLDLLAEHPEFGIQDNTHGSADQRVQAFSTGWYQGAARCVDSYAR